MACDSAWSTDGRIATLKTKLVRLRSGAIYGSAGDSDDRSMLALVQDATRFEDFPSREVLEELKGEFEALVLLPSGKLVNIDKEGAYEMAAPFAAIGNGARVAIGAMAAGASAKRAAELTCQWENGCKGPVHTMRPGRE